VQSVRKPWWQQATALVTVSTGGVISGFTFVPGAAAAITSPASVPLHLLALREAAKPAEPSDSGLRAAIVNVAGYYLRLAQTRTPAQMETLIWGKASVDSADHGPSCAAFASLTLELAAQAVGQQSWVTGGTSYPWPLHQWADVRVDPNPASLSITSMVQDAQAHQRWHPVGDGYQPQPGDWVLFNQHVEVVTSYASGVLDTIGADSLPNYTVNAHSFPGPLADQGVEGFVDNGHLGGGQRAAAAQATTRGHGPAAAQRTQPAAGTVAAGAAHGKNAGGSQGAGKGGLADIPGADAPTAGLAIGAAPVPGAVPSAGAGSAAGSGSAVAAPAPTEPDGGSAAVGVHGHGAGASQPAPGDHTSKGGAGSSKGIANIPGAGGTADPPALTPGAASRAPASATDQVAASAADPVPAPRATAAPFAHPAAPKTPYRKYSAPERTRTPGTSAQQAFINQIAPGAVAAQQRYGVPASVTIAQAIDESGWGGSALAARDHNLFGIKGTGPAGVVNLPTQEYLNGQWVTVNAGFRVYHNIAESIADHAELLATSGFYQRAMADRAVPDAFANDLTGVYATDPEYGANLIALMKLYNLYRFDTPATHQQPAPASQPAVHPRPDQAATAHLPAGQPTIPGLTQAPAVTAAPDGPAMPAIPGSGIIPDRTAGSDGTTSGSTASPGNATVPGTTAIPGTTGIPGSVSVPGSATIPGNAIVPDAATIPGTTGIPGSATIPGATGIPGSASILGSTATPGSTTVPGSTAIPASATIPGTTGTPRRATVPDGAEVSGGVVIPGAGQQARTTPKRQAAPGGLLSGQRSSSSGPAAVAGALFVAGSAKVRRSQPARASRQAAVGPRIPRLVAPTAPRYRPQLPDAVATAFFLSAKTPLARAEPLYRDVAEQARIPWELLAACDWMQCQADPRFSPAHGEKIGKLNSDGTVYQTKSEALAQCASDLIELAGMVYQINLTAPDILSVRALADAFAAFRWGGLLKRHRVSAMEFPYSVAGLTAQHMKMHWPSIRDPDAPDRPGRKFRGPFGAVPVVLSLHYPATV
jgi:flagellum-specific peptidoglycan hydrolase FlgJ